MDAGKRIRWGEEEGREGISYVKIPSDYLEAVGALESPRQQDASLGAYVRYFMGVSVGNVPKTIRPTVIVGRGIADRIVTGALTGGIRKEDGGTQQVPEANPASTQQVPEANPASTHTTTQGATGSPPAETSSDPARVPSRVPNTQYKDPYTDPGEYREGDSDNILWSFPTLEDVTAYCEEKGAWVVLDDDLHSRWLKRWTADGNRGNWKMALSAYLEEQERDTFDWKWAKAKKSWEEKKSAQEVTRRKEEAKRLWAQYDRTDEVIDNCLPGTDETLKYIQLGREAISRGTAMREERTGGTDSLADLLAAQLDDMETAP